MPRQLNDGCYEKSNSKWGMDVQSFHVRRRDIRPFIERRLTGRAEFVDLRSTEGILGGGLDAALAAASQDVVAAWADLMFERYSGSEEHLGCADQLLAVLRKL